MTTAPMRRSVPVTVELPTHVTPAEAFRIIAPIDLSLVFRRWGPFPAVVGVREQDGAWDAPGRSRRPQLSDGSSALERLTEYTPPHSFAYEISGLTGPLGRLVERIRGEWTMTPDGSGAVVRWTYAFTPRPGRRALLLLVVAPLWRRYAARMLSATVQHVEQVTAVPEAAR